MNAKELKANYIHMLTKEGSGLLSGEDANTGLMRAASGRTVTAGHLDASFEHIGVRRDCGDFHISPILRMLYLYGSASLITPEALAETEEVLLDYDYWFSENNIFPGRQLIWTENHVMHYLANEYLAVRYYPDKIFRMRGKYGRELFEYTKLRVLDWINVKLKVGFSEWDSSCYADANFSALFNLYDFADEPEVRTKARDLIDIMMFGMAINSYRGNFGCTHGRAYTVNIVNHLSTGTAKLQRVLGWQPLDESVGYSHSAAFYALGGYEVPEVISRIATDPMAEFDTFEQQSFDIEDMPAFGKGFDNYEDIVMSWHNMGYSHVKVIDKQFEMARRFGITVNAQIYNHYRFIQKNRREGREVPACIMKNYMPRINKVTRKTPDYMLSCAQSFRPGYNGFQQHIWQATFADDAVVFTNHPGSLEKGGGRPDYLAGNDMLPRAAQHKDTVICIYNIPKDAKFQFIKPYKPIPFTHAYFPKDKFDEIREADGWIFARKGAGYVALTSQNGYRWNGSDDAICDAMQNVWICHVGREAVYGDFLSFIHKVMESGVKFDGLNVTCKTPAGDTLNFGWDGPLTAGGAEVRLSGYKRYENPYCISEYFSGEYAISDGASTLLIKP